ncbi:MAG: ATP-binding cassette domain-containing protein [Candidatus Muiribacteriaceae bacterium]
MNIEVKDIDVVFEGKKIVDSLSFNFCSGVNYLITGDSGSGKTTLLNLLSLVRIPDKGMVFYNEQPVTEKNIDVLRKQNGIVFQNSYLINELTVYQNIELFYKGKKERISELAQRLSISDRLYSKAGTISVGEKKRCGFLRVLLREPNIIFADEPFAGLDNDNISILNGLLTDYTEGSQERSVIIVTHMPEKVLIPHQVIKLSHGMIL